MISSEYPIIVIIFIKPYFLEVVILMIPIFILSKENKRYYKMFCKKVCAAI